MRRATCPKAGHLWRRQKTSSNSCAPKGLRLTPQAAKPDVSGGKAGVLFARK